MKTFETLLRAHEVRGTAALTVDEFLDPDTASSKRVRPAAESAHPRPVKQMRGHTSYLTFATLLPPPPPPPPAAAAATAPAPTP